VKHIQIIAGSYYKLLTTIDWDDEVLLLGLKEGLSKFVSNAYIEINKKTHKQTKYLQGDYYTEEALDKIKNNDFSGLIYEHMIPKSTYIQKPCVEMARNGKLTVQIVTELLSKYWKIAVITKEQDKLLSRRKMPDGWDGKDIFARYRKANIYLIQADKK
tara:strand:+ start:204 stop:680 length:477 start_codon:yes stop_codon:yes gene_type:complete